MVSLRRTYASLFPTTGFHTLNVIQNLIELVGKWKIQWKIHVHSTNSFFHQTC